MTGRSDLVDLEGVRCGGTDLAIRVDFGNKAGPVWLPKSLVEVEPGATPGAVIVTMPQWLAEDRELV